LKVPEQRVVFKLIWTQFKHDKKFKMGVLAIVPLTLVYMFMGMSDMSTGGGIINPFASEAAAHGKSVLLFVAPGLLPVMIMFNVMYSTSYKSSWIFFATPSDLSEVIFATVRFLQYVFIIPYLIVLCAALAYMYSNVLGAILMTLLIYFLLDAVMFLVFPFVAGVPFGLPPKTGQKSTVFIAILIFMPLYLIPIVVFSKLTEKYDVTTVYLFFLIPAIILERITLFSCRRKLRKRAATIRYVA
jgi:hypothetical protein